MRTTRKVLAATATALGLLTVQSAEAQRRRGLEDVTPAPRHGFWLSGGLAAGSENVRFSNEPGGYGEENVQPAFWFALGGTVNPHLRLGGEVNGWVWDHHDLDTGYQVTDYLAAVLLTGQFYPADRLGLFLKGGVGLSRSGTSISGGSGVGENGFAYLVGAGYDIRLGRTVFLTPLVNLMYHRSNPDPNDPGGLGTMHERVFTIGVGITFQPGR